MERVSTWGDIIDLADAEYFVGRQNEIAVFRQEISRQHSMRLLFFISGQGGVGKTTLLKRFGQIASELNFVVVESDEQQNDIPSILAKFLTQLHQDNISLKQFEEQYKKYRQLKQEIENDPDAPQGLASIIGQSLVKAGFVFADEIPILRQGIRLVDQNAMAEQAGEWSAYLAKKLANKIDEVELLRDPVEVLSKLFFLGLNELSKSRKVILCFDNFEVTRAYLDSWILHLRNYQPSQNIRLIIASRTPPGPSWDKLTNVIQHISLGLFTEQEAHDYLDRIDIKDVQRRNEIIEFSGKLPILMSWLAAPETDTPDPILPTADIVDRFFTLG